jgi:hypothetical protein
LGICHHGYQSTGVEAVEGAFDVATHLKGKLRHMTLWVRSSVSKVILGTRDPIISLAIGWKSSGLLFEALEDGCGWSSSARIAFAFFYASIGANWRWQETMSNNNVRIYQIKHVGFAKVFCGSQNSCFDEA